MLPVVAKCRCVAGIVACVVFAGTASGQGPVHYLNRADMPPGAIGLRQLERGGPLPGYFQPVEVSAPAGTLVSIASEAGFAGAAADKLLAGMQIGHVYRLRVANIPKFEGEEVFPTIELVDRLYPPPGQAARFPVPIVLTQEDLEYALDGRYVLRVIYVENPHDALPVREIPGQQRYRDIGPRDDAMETADRLGRPIAILRMGSRVPLPEEDQGPFLYRHPPVQILPAPPAVGVARNSGLEDPIEPPPQIGGRPTGGIPREPLRR